MKLKVKLGRAVGKVCGLTAAAIGGGISLLSGKGMSFALTTTIDDVKNISGDVPDSVNQLNNKIGGLGQAGYKIVFTAAIFILIIGLVIAGIMFAMANTQSRQDAKERLIHVAIGTIIVTAAVAIITALASFVQGFTQQANT